MRACQLVLPLSCPCIAGFQPHGEVAIMRAGGGQGIAMIFERLS
jgi:hypothetical protein